MAVDPVKVLVACEFSGVVRRAFDACGFDVCSCDLLPSEDGSNRHITGDVRDALNDRWDVIIAFPTCTYLTCAAEWAYADGPYHQKVKPSTLTGLARARWESRHAQFSHTSTAMMPANVLASGRKVCLFSDPRNTWPPVS